MSKKWLTLSVVLIVLAGTFLTFNNNMTIAAIGTPTRLNIIASPPSVLADNSTYSCIFVQLLDSDGKPARAVQNTTISLSSSLTKIGTIDTSVIIVKNETFALSNFTSTFNPGTTIISASSSGYATVQTPMVTVAPIPSVIAVFGCPSTLPADGNSYEAIMVQLQDSSGSPARAPQGGVEVTLVCSNTNVGTVTPMVAIPGGETFAVATFTTTTLAETEAKPESAIITAISPGYASKQVTITTTPVATNPNMLKIFIGTPQVPADQNSYRQVAVSLQNASGYAAIAQFDIPVTIASDDKSIGDIASVTIKQSQAYAMAAINTTYKAGSVTITAVTTNLAADHQSIATTGFVPSKLVVYCAPASLPADNKAYQPIQVQLQDAQGRPAKDPQGDVIVNLFSSQSTMGTVSSTLIIPFGKTQASGNFTVTNIQGETFITAQASDYTTGQASLKTYLIDYSPLQVTITGNPLSINSGGNIAVVAYVTSGTTPVTDATVTFSSNNGGTFSPTINQGNGYYNCNFTAPNFTQTTISIINATASKTGYITHQGSLQLTVAAPTPTPAPTPTATPSPEPTSLPVESETGSIQLCIKDTNDAPLNDTVIYSISQPVGMKTVTQITNATGYVWFTNLTSGEYIFSIAKLGYLPINATLNLNDQPLALTINLLSDAAAQTDNSSVLIGVVVAAVVIAVVLLVVLVLVRRGNLTKSRKLLELQKTLTD